MWTTCTLRGPDPHRTSSDFATGHLTGAGADNLILPPEDHLDETRFAWRGLHGESNAFYYRVHSPVMLIEYDNHPGIFLDNDEPERFHVHTIVREPHGNDYGQDLLAQHYARHHTP